MFYIRMVAEMRLLVSGTRCLITRADAPYDGLQRTFEDFLFDLGSAPTMSQLIKIQARKKRTVAKLLLQNGAPRSQRVQGQREYYSQRKQRTRAVKHEQVGTCSGAELGQSYDRDLAPTKTRATCFNQAFEYNQPKDKPFEDV